MDTRKYPAAAIPPKRRLWRNTGALAGFVLALLLLVGIAIWYTAGIDASTAPYSAMESTQGETSEQP